VNRPEVAANRPDPAAMFREAGAALRPIVTGPAPPLRAERQYDRLQSNFVTLLFDRKDPAFDPELDATKAAFQRTVDRYPERDDLRFEYVQFANKVGLMWFSADRFDRADVWLALAARECETVVDAHPGVVSYRAQLADTLLNRAVAVSQIQGRPADTFLSLYRAASDQARRLVRDRPGVRDLANLGLDVCVRYAGALTALGRHAEAVGVWDEAGTYAPPERVRVVNLRRELARAQAGDAGAAVAAARRLADVPFTTAAEHGFYAAVLATAAAETKNGKPVLPADEAHRLRAEAGTLLEKAKALPDFAHVKPDLGDVPALKPLLEPKAPTNR
jgi:hypothetical protein